MLLTLDEEAGGDDEEVETEPETMIATSVTQLAPVIPHALT